MVLFLQGCRPLCFGTRSFCLCPETGNVRTEERERERYLSFQNFSVPLTYHSGSLKPLLTWKVTVSWQLFSYVLLGPVQEPTSRLVSATLAWSPAVVTVLCCHPRTFTRTSLSSRPVLHLQVKSTLIFCSLHFRNLSFFISTDFLLPFFLWLPSLRTNFCSHHTTSVWLTFVSTHHPCHKFYCLIVIFRYLNFFYQIPLGSRWYNMQNENILWGTLFEHTDQEQSLTAFGISRWKCTGLSSHTGRY